MMQFDLWRTVTDDEDRWVQMLLHPNFFEEVFRDGVFVGGLGGEYKTTFLREKLVPRLKADKAWVTFVDLGDRRRIGAATWVRKAIRQSVAQLVMNSNVQLSLDPMLIGTEKGAFISEAFSEIADITGRQMELILADAPELMRSWQGLYLLMALKAARDAVNLRPNNRELNFLQVIGTGMDHRKIRTMARNYSQPFYGSDIWDFVPASSSYYFLSDRKMWINIHLEG